MFSVVAAPIYIPTSRAPIRVTSVISCLFDTGHSDELLSHCGFELHFPDD